MKKIILIFLLLSLSGCYFHLREADAIVMVRGGGGTASCITEVDSDVTGTTLIKVGDVANYGAAIEFVGSVSDCICKVVVSLKKNNTPGGTLSFKLREKGAGDHPQTLIATAVETKTAADVTTSFADYTITFSTCATISATNNYITIETDTLSGSSAIYFATAQNTTGTHRTELCTTAGCDTGWVASDTSAEGYRSVYK